MLTVNPPPKGQSLRKSVDTLALVPTRDRISILVRKVYNVMMHYAQDQGVDQDIYRARLVDIVSGIDFNSNNTEIIKEHLRQMATTKVEWQSPTKGEGASWEVSALIAHAKLINQQNEVLIEWSYAPNIKQAILDPQRYARISLTLQAKFKTISGLALYEICSRYVDNPGGLTARNSWEWWRPVLTGAPESQNNSYAEWKYFNRDIVKTAVSEVNRLTDLSIEIIEHKKGRAVIDLQFKVSRKKADVQPVASALSPVNLKEVGRAIQAGVPQDKAEKLLGKYGDELFQQGIDALEARSEKGHLGAVRSPDKYLAVTLASLTTSPSETIATPILAPKQETKAKRIEQLEKYRNLKREEAQALYAESPAGEQTAMLNDFETEVLPEAGPVVIETYKKRGTNAPMTKAYFVKFLCNHFFGGDWDSPSDSQLLEFEYASQRV